MISKNLSSGWAFLSKNYKKIIHWCVDDSDFKVFKSCSYQVVKVKMSIGSPNPKVIVYKCLLARYEDTTMRPPWTANPPDWVPGLGQDQPQIGTLCNKYQDICLSLKVKLLTTTKIVTEQKASKITISTESSVFLATVSSYGVFNQGCENIYQD